MTAALPQRPLAFPRERAARRPPQSNGSRGADAARTASLAGARRGEVGGWRRDLCVLLLISRVRPERDARGSGPERSVRAREAGLALPRAAPLAAGHRPSRPGRPPGAMGLCCCKAWSGHLRAPKGNSWRARAPQALSFCAPGAASFRLRPGLRAPPQGLVCRFSEPPDTCLSLELAQVRLQVPRLRTWLVHPGAPLAPPRWLGPGRGGGWRTGGSGPSWAAGPPSSLLGPRCPGSLPARLPVPCRGSPASACVCAASSA